MFFGGGPFAGLFYLREFICTFAAMGNFAEKTRLAAKFVVSQLPQIEIDGTRAYIRPYVHGVALFNARSRAGELLQLEGSTKISDGFLAMAAINVLMGQLLVDVDGRNFITDNDDMEAWMEFIRENPELQKELLEKSGFTAWIKSTSETATTSDTLEPMSLDEVALGNSELPLVTV